MPNLLPRWLRRAPPEAKRSRAPGAIAFTDGGRAVWTARDYAALAREGFQRNAVVHRAVRLVSEAAAALPLTLLDRGRALDAHPLLDLLRRPNPREGGARFLEGVYGHLLVSGNAYVEAVRLEGVPRELYGLRPDRMRAVAGADGWPIAYEYGVGTAAVRFPSGGEGVSPILHLTLFHPLDDLYGLAPMEAAAAALDIHNAAGRWNKALLDNAARPSGALVHAGPGGGTLTEEQFARLKAELEDSYQGAANAGRPLLLDGGVDWRPLSLSPKEMDFVEAKNAAAREIALAFGVPPLLLGLPGDNTHANYAEVIRQGTGVFLTWKDQRRQRIRRPRRAASQKMTHGALATRETSAKFLPGPPSTKASARRVAPTAQRLADALQESRLLLRPTPDANEDQQWCRRAEGGPGGD